MTRRLTLDCSTHSDPYECPDVLVTYDEKFDEHGLIIHDGGSSHLLISFCPWCGRRLPDSKRDRWFEELEALGFSDPFEEELPEQYRTAKWWKEAPEL